SGSDAVTTAGTVCPRPRAKLSVGRLLLSVSAETFGARLAGAKPDHFCAITSTVGHDSPERPRSADVSRNMQYHVGVRSIFWAQRKTYEPKMRSMCAVMES